MENLIMKMKILNFFQLFPIASEFPSILSLLLLYFVFVKLSKLLFKQVVAERF